MLPISDPNVEIITMTEMNAAPPCPNSADIVSAATRRDAWMVLDRKHVEVRHVRGEIDGDDRSRADQDGSRQVRLWILDLAAREREVGEPVVRPENRNEREAEEAGFDWSLRSTRGAASWRRGPRRGRTPRRRAASTRRTWRRVERPARRPRVWTPVMLAAAATTMAPQPPDSRPTVSARGIDANRPKAVLAEHRRDAAERRRADEHELRPAVAGTRTDGPILRAGKRRCRRSEACAADSSAKARAPQSTMSPPTTQTASMSVGSGTRVAMLAGVRKMPPPIVMPTTRPTELQRPSRRTSVGMAGLYRLRAPGFGLQGLQAPGFGLRGYASGCRLPGAVSFPVAGAEGRAIACLVVGP